MPFGWRRRRPGSGRQGRDACWIPAGHAVTVPPVVSSSPNPPFRHGPESTRRRFLGGATGLAAGLAGLAGEPGAATGPVKPRTPVIDCHVHCGIGQELLAPYSTENPVELILRNMRLGGIDQCVIFPISNPTYERANIAIAETCRRFPGRFIGFAKHDAGTERFRIRSLLLREVRELGLRGYKCHAPQPTPDVLDVIADLRIPCLYHPRKVADLVEIARAYPGVDFILAHLGSPQSRNPEEHLNAIEAAKHHPNVHLETSYCLETRYLERAVNELPPERILFGSDGPDTNNALEIFKIRMLRLPKGHEELILGGNIQRLLSKYQG